MRPAPRAGTLKGLLPETPKAPERLQAKAQGPWAAWCPGAGWGILQAGEGGGGAPASPAPPALAGGGATSTASLSVLLSPGRDAPRPARPDCARAGGSPGHSPPRAPDHPGVRGPLRKAAAQAEPALRVEAQRAPSARSPQPGTRAAHARLAPPRPAPPRPGAPGPCPSSGPGPAAPRTDTWRHFQDQPGDTRRPRISCVDGDASQSLRCACCPAPRGRPCRPLAGGGGLATNRRGPAPRPGAAHPVLRRGTGSSRSPAPSAPRNSGQRSGSVPEFRRLPGSVPFHRFPSPPSLCWRENKVRRGETRDWTSRPAFFPGLRFQAFASRSLPCVLAARLY